MNFHIICIKRTDDYCNEWSEKILMKKILVIGMSDTLGGVETYIYNLIKMIDKKKFTFDFLVIGQDNKSVFEKEINDILGNDKK